MTADSAADAAPPLDGKMQAIVDHFAAGGTLKSLANLTGSQLEAIYAVAFNHFTARKFDEAIKLLKFLCLYDHTNPRWYLGLGTAQQQAGEYESALRSYGLATLMDVDDPRPQAQAGYCLMALGRWPEAQSALEGAIMACDAEPARHAILRQQAESLLERAKKQG